MHDRNHENACGKDAIEWIRAHLDLRPSNAVDALYDRMDFQSGCRLPVIYEPFDGRKRGHFVDRGQILDYVLTAGAGRVLDFGPGDGWPSLLMAPMVEQVVGVDGSRRRVEVCTENARRLGIANATFVHVPPGEPLPFEDEFFNGVAAASSIEQTPEPRETLEELCRVLKPKGQLRMHYESLGFYAGGKEREIWFPHRGPDVSQLVVFDRDVAGERVCHYSLVLGLSRSDAQEVFERHGAGADYAGLTPAVLEELCAHLIEASTWTTQHPSCRTLLRMLPEAGFRSAKATYDGGWFAKRLFDRLSEGKRPEDRKAVDRLLRHLVEVVVDMEAPCAAPAGEWEPWITAVK